MGVCITRQQIWLSGLWLLCYPAWSKRETGENPQLHCHQPSRLPAPQKKEEKGKRIFPALIFPANAKLNEPHLPAACCNTSSRGKQTAKAGGIQLKVSNVPPLSTEQAERKIRFELQSGTECAEQHAIKLHKLLRCPVHSVINVSALCEWRAWTCWFPATCSIFVVRFLEFVKRSLSKDSSKSQLLFTTTQSSLLNWLSTEYLKKTKYEKIDANKVEPES